jgi:DNA-binding SARP family transcriptional activator
VELAPDDERAVRRLIRLLDRQGNRSAALGVYETFRDRLAADYGVPPSPETLALIAEVRGREQRVWESPLRGWPLGPA